MQNLVFLTVDSLRADHCSFHGCERDTTPNLASLADGGVVCSRAYSASSHTREAVGSLLTGQFPHRCVDADYRLAAPPLSTLLANSHRCGAFHSNPFLSRAYGYDRDFHAFDDDLSLSRFKLVALLQRLWDRVRGHHYARAETINERALEWLDSLPDGTPFFLWNHYMDAHGPYEPPEPYRSRYCDRSVSDAEAQQRWYDATETPEAVSEDDRQLLVDLYDGEIAYVDDRIGAFLDALDERGLLDETLVVVTADHGELLGEHGAYSHPRKHVEELLHVPLLASGPSVPDATVPSPTSTLDVAPTACRALDCGDGDFDGVALQDAWTDPEGSADRHVVSEVRGKDEPVRRYRVTGADATLSFEHPLAEDDPTVPETGRPALEATLRDHLRSVGDHDDATAAGPSDEEVPTDRLEALGYK